METTDNQRTRVDDHDNNSKTHGVDRAVEILDSDTFKVRRDSFSKIKPYYPS